MVYSEPGRTKLQQAGSKVIDGVQGTFISTTLVQMAAHWLDEYQKKSNKYFNSQC